MKDNEFAMITGGLSRAVELLEGLGHPDRLVQNALDKMLAIAAREIAADICDHEWVGGAWMADGSGPAEICHKCWTGRREPEQTSEKGDKGNG